MEIIRRKGNGDNLSLIAQYVKLGRYQEDDHLSEFLEATLGVKVSAAIIEG